MIEDWKYEHTYSGTPQGGVLSPLLANIYLHQLDTFVTECLIPKYTRGEKRADNPEYARYGYHIRHARQRNDPATAKQTRTNASAVTGAQSSRPERSGAYVTCATLTIFSWVLQAQERKQPSSKPKLQMFLQNTLRLTLSDEKTLITHARTQHARFLNYAVSVYQVNDKITRRSDNAAATRSINGNIRLSIPHGLIDERCKRYQRNGKSIHEGALIFQSDAAILDTYQRRFRGIAQYYKYAVDRHKLGKLKYAMEQSLVKTLAAKFKTRVSQIYIRYKGTQMVGATSYKTLQVEVPTKTTTRVIFWGAVPLTTVRIGAEPIEDDRYAHQAWNVRTDLIQRLQADTCEMCGHSGQCEVHHIRKLSNLRQRWHGRAEKPAWTIRMIAMQRKTLVVCKPCHRDIHAGRPIPKDRS